MITPQIKPANSDSRIQRVSQATIVIRSVSESISVFSEMQSILLKWLEFKVGHSLPRLMALGETDSLDRVGSMRTETVKLDDPLFWSFRRDDHDINFPQRNWVTEASLAHDRGIVRLGYRLSLVNWGLPVGFQRSVPRFMQDVARKFTVVVDDTEIDLQPTPVEWEHEVDELTRLLENPHRTIPVIGISAESAEAPTSYLLNANLISRRLLGTAHVRTLSWQAARMLTEQLGRQNSVYLGAARVWVPGQAVKDGYRYSHPLYLADRIREDGASQTSSSLIETVLRISAERRDAEKIAPSFTEARRAAASLGRLNADRAGESAEQLLPLLRAEIETLAEARLETQATHDRLLDLAEIEIKNAELARDQAAAEVIYLSDRVAKLLDFISEKNEASPPSVPDTFSELEQWASDNLYPEVIVLPRALKAAKKSHYQDIQFVYKVLLLIKNYYVPMRRSGEGELWNKWSLGLQQYGLECTPTFGSTGSGAFGDEYFVDWLGKRQELDIHIKGSNSRDPRYGFRIYFFWCKDNAAVVIGSLPSHLTNNVT